MSYVDELAVIWNEENGSSLQCRYLFCISLCMLSNLCQIGMNYLLYMCSMQIYPETNQWIKVKCLYVKR